MELRDYQQESRAAVQKEWSKGIKRTLLVLPTGCGKTIVFSKIIEDQIKLGERVLVLAHRNELLEQASEKLEKTTGLMTALEKANQSSLGSFLKVVVGSVQTLQREKRLHQFSSDYFDTIIVDEAHHCISKGYQRILNYFEKAKVLGVTATPDRGDMQNLGSYFQSVAYEYTLPTAVKNGYLSPMKALTIPLKLDLTKVSQQAGDFKTRDLGNALEPFLEQIAEEMLIHCVGRKTVVFLPLIQTSCKFKEILNKKGFKAAEINGQSKDRVEVLERFEANQYNILCNAMLLTEGWDCPSVDCVIVLRPTKIRSLYSQMVGRGTRLYPGKAELLLLDFLWHTERHELCRPAHLIAPTDEIAQLMSKHIEELGAPVDLETAETEVMGSLAEQREAALAKRLEENRKRRGKLVDPLEFEMSIQAKDLLNYSPFFDWEHLPPSSKQLQTLANYGISTSDIENAGKVTKLIDRLVKRQKEGLTTPKQIRCLEKLGFEAVGTWSFGEAQRLINHISKNGWSVPSDINPKKYSGRLIN